MASEKRMIYVSVLKKDICEWCNEHYPDDPCEPSDCPAMEYIDSLPTVDAVEVVHGRWLNAQIQANDPFGYSTYEVDVFTCSVCGVQFDVSECRNYCPNCGAKMDGDGNG